MYSTTKRQATELGNKLLHKMKGKGWKLRVWENMGWHFKVSKYFKATGYTISVHQRNNGKRYIGEYSVLFGDDPGGDACWSSPSYQRIQRNPNLAVLAQYKMACAYVDLVDAHVTALGKFLKIEGPLS